MNDRPSAKSAWLCIGATLLVALGSLVQIVDSPTLLVPMPLHQVILAWTTGFGQLAVLPITYVVTLALLWDSDALGEFVQVASIVVLVLNVLYFVTSLGSGLRHQGSLHTFVVAGYNVVGLAAVVALAVLGRQRDAKQLQVAAYLILFAMLSWCAFPYLGELA
ncbi:MAG TPA: hypothetical protein VE907_03920 [Gammaproteobacteria bacterium]|nr:hypothetical protein [Gammaproteobacteria bacterium]